MAPLKKLDHFSPPANLQDIKDQAGLTAWSDEISQWMDNEINGADLNPSYVRTPLKYFFNGTKTPYDQTAAPAKIPWIAFPKLVQDAFPANEDRWAQTDNNRLRNQDEYLEWSVLRDGDGPNAPITSVTYTCEGPEYWDFLGRHQPEATLNLIKQMNEPLLDNTTMESFFKKDANGRYRYNKNNKYNNSSKGGTIISLAHPNNSLGAEVDIASQGTVVRKVGNRIVTSADELIKISAYGDPDRHSDPKIGGDINDAVRQGYSITIADPVAIYMHSFHTTDLSLDTSGNRDGTNKQPIPPSWFNLQRGTGLNKIKPMGLRLRIRNETGTKTDDGMRLLDVSDIWDDSTQTNIRYGAQFADHIEMGVSGALGPKGSPPTLADAEGPPQEKGGDGTQSNGNTVFSTMSVENNSHNGDVGAATAFFGRR